MQVADLTLLDNLSDDEIFLEPGFEPIFVTLGDVGTVDIDVCFEADTVFDVKQELQKMFGIAPKYQRLYRGVEELDDDYALCYYGLKPYDDIDLVLKIQAVFNAPKHKYKIRFNYLRSMERDRQEVPLYD